MSVIDLLKKYWKKIILISQYFFLLLSFLFFLLGYFNENFNFQIFGIVCLGINNLIFASRKMGDRVLFFFFTIMLFTFMYSRPFISMIRGNIWWGYFEPESIQFSLTALFISTLAIYVGVIIYSAIETKWFPKMEDRTKETSEKYRKRMILFVVSFLMFVICWTCATLIDIEKFLFVRGHSYEEFYVSYKTVAPLPIKALATMMPYSICFLLACKPRKKIVFPVLTVYVLGGVPTLLMGQRNTLVLRLLFVLVYYIIQNYNDNRDKWLGKFEKLGITIGTPFLLLLLGAYNYIRANTAVESKGIVSLIMDFFYKQGTQFDTLTSGYENLEKLPFINLKNYTFGGFIDSFKHGFIAQKIFDSPGLGNGNNPIKGIVSNSYAHNLAYVYRRDAYLAGNGNGGSYLLDVNADYGILGIILFSLLFGVILIYLVRLFTTRNYLSSVFVLCCLNDIFWTPRGGATEWLLFLVKPSFIFSVIALIGGYLIFKEFKLVPQKMFEYLKGKELI
ncbi:O-antigen polysaccharide polymerase Wzy family protein [Enterococcus dongliensis]|uniref:O-antigen polysaccharide polymerase Wzy family protein n=1 Tax=Enterococcus dongliensis TaxID=2559925 RepID=UPI0028922442|nr:O-antigen polysaccharide polymerase Wzy family protein [Enterococcus dongliensis]MDT2641325.1 O-antigen polysaccharide polymerase Wzy family protein [Enterococcus dongliensis]MDT2646545.1 O-antigen polysaccharide polymerase Wzy family protein [Enterococcus dongliensis]MDT2710542.1 O-antigen polysaccharide polymerase Wzy family protein [Enterococcus dongliensis]